jgi:hypothetical protein
MAGSTRLPEQVGQDPAAHHTQGFGLYDFSVIGIMLT